MFSWLFNRTKKPKLSTPCQKMYDLLLELRDINGDYDKLRWLANLIINAKVTNLYVKDAVDFLIVDPKRKREVFEMLEKL